MKRYVYSYLNFDIYLSKYPVCLILLLGLGFNQAFSQDKSAPGEVFIYRPKSKTSGDFTVFFNRQKIGTLPNGGRLSYKMLSEGSLTIAIMKSEAYYEPGAVSKNTRTMTIKKGNSYYFEIDSKGYVEYILPATLGKKNYENGSDFSGEPQKLEENAQNPIPSLSVEKEIVRFRQVYEKTKKELFAKEKEIQNNVQAYFADLKKQAKLAEAVHPSVSITIEEDSPLDGRPRYNLEAVYSYEVLEEGLKANLAHFPSGQYDLKTSPAATATTLALKETLEKYLDEYFEPGSKIYIQITGSADNVPITNVYNYKGEYNDFNNQEFYLTDHYASASIKDITGEINSQKMTLNLSKQARITQNEQLAFLRTYGIRQFIMNNISSLKKTQNLYTHKAKIETGEGGKFRKVTIELLIEDVLRNK